MLRYDFYGKVVFEYRNVGISFHSFDKSSLNLEAGVVGVVKNSELRVAAFAVKIESSVVVLVEVHTVLHEKFNAFWSLAHYFFNGFLVAYVVARNHCVFYVLFKIVYLEICN